MSGIRQFTPEDGQYSLLRPTAASKPSKYRNLYGLSPLTASFGVLPLETSPSESYVISPTGTLTENSDQKIIAKRQLLGNLGIFLTIQCRLWLRIVASLLWRLFEVVCVLLIESVVHFGRKWRCRFSHSIFWVKKLSSSEFWVFYLEFERFDSVCCDWMCGFRAIVWLFWKHRKLIALIRGGLRKFDLS